MHVCPALNVAESHTLKCIPLLGTTEEETRENFVTWMNKIIKRSSQAVKIAEDDDGELQEGCYEQMTCSDLQRIMSIFEKLSAWREECIANGCTAGKFFTVTGNESKMTIIRQRLGPFL